MNSLHASLQLRLEFELPTSLVSLHGALLLLRKLSLRVCITFGSREKGKYHLHKLI